jgi:molybdate transport system ATP-binding protein
MKIKLRKLLTDFCFELDTQISTTGISVIFGRSGAGKTTLINLIAGIEKPDNGHISFQQTCFFDSDQAINLPIHQRQIGYVFQQSRLFPHFNVEKNLKYAYSPKEDPEGLLLQSIFNLLDLNALLGRYPNELSGGEKQRVAIGRALLRKPKLLLMDEPLASLDIPKKRELLPYLEKLNKELRLPILYVTHSLDEVLFLADEILLIDKGQLILQGKTETIWNHDKMLPWLKTSNLSTIMHTTVFQHHCDYPLTSLALNDQQVLWVAKINQPVSTKLRIRIYAKDVSITLNKAPATQTSIRNILRVRITEIVKEQQKLKLKLALGDNHCWAEITQWALQDLELRVNQQVYAQIKGISINNQDWAMA